MSLTFPFAGNDGVIIVVRNDEQHTADTTMVSRARSIAPSLMSVDSLSRHGDSHKGREFRKGHPPIMFTRKEPREGGVKPVGRLGLMFARALFRDTTRASLRRIRRSTSIVNCTVANCTVVDFNYPSVKNDGRFVSFSTAILTQVEDSTLDKQSLPTPADGDGEGPRQKMSSVKISEVLKRKVREHM